MTTTQTDHDATAELYFRCGWEAALREVRIQRDRLDAFLSEQIGDES